MITSGTRSVLLPDGFGRTALDVAMTSPQAESFPYFAAAVLAANAAGLDEAAQATVAALSWMHVSLRVGYWLCYAADLPHLRTAMFVPAFQCCVFILLEALK